MDFNESPEHKEQYQPHQAQSMKKSRSIWKILLMLLIAAAMLGAGFAAGYWWREQDAKNNAKTLQTEIDTLKQSLANTKEELQKAQAADAAKQPTQEQLDNIEAAVKSGNYAALEQYMADKVTVILAASEGLGERTAAQAVSDLKYIDSGTDPWDCDLPASTIDEYQKGDYKQYFTDGSLVCKSANGYVVSFTFNNAAKISVVFMTASADLL